MSYTSEHIINELFEKYSASSKSFKKDSLRSLLAEKKRNYLLRINEVLDRYNLKTLKEIEEAIKGGKIPEHPAWEELIDLENIEYELREIEQDLAKIS